MQIIEIQVVIFEVKHNINRQKELTCSTFWKSIIQKNICTIWKTECTFYKIFACYYYFINFKGIVCDNGRLKVIV